MNRFFPVVAITILMLLIANPDFAGADNVITAKACIVLDDHDAVLFSKNSSVKLPPASTVKLMTAMVALDHLEPQTIVTVSRRAGLIRSIRPSLKSGDELTVEDLLHMTLMQSINSAAVALAEATSGSEEEFAILMNLKAREIGANDTRFVTASGLPKGNQYTTARDLTIILKRALTYPLIEEIIGKQEWTVTTASGRKLELENTANQLWSRSNLVGGKTGFTNSARHCFVGAIDTDNGRVYTAVLGAPSRSRLWEGTLALADIGINPAVIVSFEETRDRRVKSSARKLKKRPRKAVQTL